MFVVARLFIFDNPSLFIDSHEINFSRAMSDLLTPINEDVRKEKIIINIRHFSLPNRIYWQPMSLIAHDMNGLKFVLTRAG